MERAPKRFKVLSLRELGKAERDTVSKDYKKIDKHFKVLTLRELGKTERDTIAKDFEKLKTSELTEAPPPYFTSTSPQQNFNSSFVKQNPLYLANHLSASSIYRQPMTPPRLSEHSWHDESPTEISPPSNRIPSPQSITAIEEYDGLNIDISDLIWTPDVSKKTASTNENFCKLQEYMLKQSIKNLHISVKSTIAAYTDLRNCFLPGEKLKVDPPPSEIDPKLWSELLELLSAYHNSDENIKCLNAYNRRFRIKSPQTISDSSNSSSYGSDISESNKKRKTFGN